MRFTPFSRFIVKDGSMLPNFYPGDRVLTFNWINFAKGDVVVFARGETYLIKRVIKCLKLVFEVTGDNKQASSVYKIRRTSVVGKVIFKY